jgi:gliding motility-associated-like protein
MINFISTTAFSPNGDGQNDEFHELQQVGIASLFFAVYNRWGQLIYQTSIKDGKWDVQI